MSMLSIPVRTLAGTPTTLGGLGGPLLLIVNVASRCGLTPQYEGLEKLHRRYREQGLTVVGAPCNQFMGQEPGTAEEIQEFCSTRYDVTFPLLEKLDVNGPGRHPVFEALTTTPDADGQAGDVQWNFEKFLVGPDGRPFARFRPRVEPDDPDLIDAIEQALVE
ncbi:glutathione peroxidase [Allonocardiopsis opalescens]|uniref:Glutathione peroxidase n=1 Tax=Allonocardiopsis opalescens TaxID=1144618 RepID=A0A2T0Q0A4_9ACTN|nr:glutathione peroxidase [Allonocardiopsis opalescens]PRX97214.1 glutathione peroxidase [Allonocardiopsis opalescens]